MEEFSKYLIFRDFFENQSGKLKVSKILTSVTGTLHEHLVSIIFKVISPSIFPRMRKVSDKSYRGKQNTFYVLQSSLENCTFYEIVWKNILEPDRIYMAI